MLRLDHTSTLLCLAARSTHLAPDWLLLLLLLLLLLFCLVVFVDVVVVVLSLGSYHYPEPPSPQSPQRDPLGHSTNGTAARGHMTRKWRPSTNRSQRQTDRQTDRQTVTFKRPLVARTLSVHGSDWTWPNSVYLRLWLQTALFTRREINSPDSAPLSLFFSYPPSSSSSSSSSSSLLSVVRCLDEEEEEEEEEEVTIELLPPRLDWWTCWLDTHTQTHTHSFTHTHINSTHTHTHTHTHSQPSPSVVKWIVGHFVAFWEILSLDSVAELIPRLPVFIFYFLTRLPLVQQLHSPVSQERCLHPPPH